MSLAVCLSVIMCSTVNASSLLFCDALHQRAARHAPSVITLRAKLIAARSVLLSVLSVCNGRAGARCVFVALWVFYYDNWKFRASIFTKLSL